MTIQLSSFGLCRQWWVPNTGGSNIPALNDLLSSWSIAFGDRVYDGAYSMQDRSMYFGSGSVLVRFPHEGVVVAKKLKDQGTVRQYSLFSRSDHAMRNEKFTLSRVVYCIYTSELCN